MDKRDGEMCALVSGWGMLMVSGNREVSVVKLNSSWGDSGAAGKALFA